MEDFYFESINNKIEKKNQAACFKFAGTLWTLAEYEGRGPRAI